MMKSIRTPSEQFGQGAPFFHPAGRRIDGVSVMAFASMKDVETFLLSDSYAAIEQAETRAQTQE